MSRCLRQVDSKTYTEMQKKKKPRKVWKILAKKNKAEELAFPNSKTLINVQ